VRRREFLGSLLAAGSLGAGVLHAEDKKPLRIATFEQDVTPPRGCPMGYGLYGPAEEILDPLKARGIVLFGDESPIVLCAVDWIGISNVSDDAFRKALADAVPTSVDRVRVHVVHQHNAPGIDASADKILAAHGLNDRIIDPDFARKAMDDVARAAGDAASGPRPVTHLGFGLAKVDKVASTRRVLTEDGKLKFWRSSAGGSAEMKAAPEGLIDPCVRLLSLWNGERPLAAITYYACHPCAFYRLGHVTSEIPGLARAARDAALPGVMNIHFNGAGGDIAVGKYNDGTLEAHARLAKRLEAGMRTAWETQKKVPVTPADLDWRVDAVRLPISTEYDEAELLAGVADAKASNFGRIQAARKLAWMYRVRSGHQTEIACLRIGPAYVLHMPGELCVEYQSAAQKMRPDAFVCMAAYADQRGPGYIPAKASYPQGGYEVSAAGVAPDVEDVLLRAMRRLLNARQ
jgi:hypothetical protein